MSHFHFLDISLFWLLIPIIALLVWQLLIREKQSPMLKGAIAPHLLRYLIKKPKRSKGLQPLIFVTILLFLLVLIIAKPVWRIADNKQSSHSPLYIVLDQSQSMKKRDVAPDRTTKSKLLINTLINAGINRPISIIATAGSSHVLIPPTKDEALLSLYLSYLSPDVMPEDGGDLARLVKRFKLTDGAVVDNAAILLVTDGMSSGQKQLSYFAKKHHMDLNVLYLNALGKSLATELNVSGFNANSMSVNDNSLIRYYMALGNGSETGSWQDESHFMIIVLTLIVALWFRKGFTLQWVFSILLFLPLGQQAQASPLDWFVTANQQATYYMTQGNYKKASELYTSPEWKGLACYYDENYTCAIKAYKKLGTKEGLFNMATAYAQNGRYQKAKDLYQAYLTLETDDKQAIAQAKANLKALAPILLEMKQLSENQHDQHPPSQDAPPPPDDVNDISKGAKRKSFGLLPKSKLSANQILSSDKATNKWLRDISKDPKEFVRKKFLAEYNRENNES
ncbi:VWA domain-containing protein [Vibrio sp. SS-MA-C1-2]|uniref:VWA domain-containing protein n=1 Tax=Vibrio sp. SS-MA-C1-2 TaxID=2908646 RepID=UPI001F467E41|nr:VWA domain-containing protein [Vibrio sp. SS-MA-C1-2]UJF18068.1 VWA domain-containing protein [Vibrio sp. SS-MA-C1-2]